MGGISGLLFAVYFFSSKLNLSLLSASMVETFVQFRRMNYTLFSVLSLYQYDVLSFNSNPDFLLSGWRGVCQKEDQETCWGNWKKTIISNSNWSEWSTDQGIISRVILKSGEREARIRFETEAKGNINRSLLPCSWGWTESSLQCRLMRGNIIKRVFFWNKKFKRLLTLSSVAS